MGTTDKSLEGLNGSNLTPSLLFGCAIIESLRGKAVQFCSSEFKIG